MEVNVKSLAEFSGLVKEFKKEWGRTDTNCYLMPAEIEQYASKKKLRYVRQKEILYFLCDEDEYQRMYFYLPKEAKARLEEPDKTTILDFVYRENKIPPGQELLYRKWSVCGFADYKLYQRMKLILKEEANLSDLLSQRVGGCHFGKAEKRFVPQIRRFWREGLDELSTPLPDSEEICRRIQRGEILCITGRDQELCAVMEVGLSPKSCFVQHVTVSGNHKRQGLGEYMMRASMQHAFEQGKETCTLWVDTQNLPAVGLYEKCGFKPEGVYSKQFIYYKK